MDANDEDWLTLALCGLRHQGCCVVTNAVDPATVQLLRAALYSAQKQMVAEVGQDRLDRAGEKGVVRTPMAYDDAFADLLENPVILDVLDHTLGSTAVLHVQNGFVLPTAARTAGGSFQETFHRDFPRYMNGYVASLNVLLCVDEFTAENGGTVVTPGTHQRAEPPPEKYLHEQMVAVECPAGSALVFDSTLWHAAGRNDSPRDRLAVNMQFTRSFFKQQFDYVRVLGDVKMAQYPERTKQILGWYTRVVTSLDEYYQPPDRRLYRSGQG